MPAKVVLTLVPLAAKPHTVEGVSRCSTMLSPKVLDREKAVGAAGAAVCRRCAGEGKVASVAAAADSAARRSLKAIGAEWVEASLSEAEGENFYYKS